MLLSRFEVPFIGPQLMAYPIQRVHLEPLIVAFECAVVESDNRPLVELWRTHLDGYLEQRTRVRWRVPRETFATLVDSVRTSDHVRRGPPPLVQQLEASLERAGVRVEGGALDPSAWFEVEDAYLQLLLPAARQIGTIRDLAIEAFARALEGLEGSRPAPLMSGPRGDLGAARELRFRSGDDGTELSPEATNAYPDLCSGPRAAELRNPRTFFVGDHPLPDHVPVIDAIAYAHRAIAFEEVLEVLVGPYRLSRGPGPFLGPPAASQAFVPPRASCAPVFRVANFPAGGAGPWRWLAGPALHEAHRVVSSAKEPDRTWADSPSSEDAALSEWAVTSTKEWANAARRGRVPALDGWRSWSHVTKGWRAVRDRFALLLKEAADTDDGVVLLAQTRHCDMEGPHAPRTAIWGGPT